MSMTSSLPSCVKPLSSWLSSLIFSASISTSRSSKLSCSQSATEMLSTPWEPLNSWEECSPSWLSAARKGNKSTILSEQCRRRIFRKSSQFLNSANCQTWRRRLSLLAMSSQNTQQAYGKSSVLITAKNTKEKEVIRWKLSWINLTLCLTITSKSTNHKKIKTKQKKSCSNLFLRLSPQRYRSILFNSERFCWSELFLSSNSSLGKSS